MLKAIGRAIRGERSEGSSSAKREARSVPSYSATSRVAYAATPTLSRSQAVGTTAVYQLERVEPALKTPTTPDELHQMSFDPEMIARLSVLCRSKLGQNAFQRALTALRELQQTQESDRGNIVGLRYRIEGELRIYNACVTNQRKEGDFSQVESISSGEKARLQQEYEDLKRQFEAATGTSWVSQA